MKTEYIYIIYLIVTSSIQLQKSFLLKFIICKKNQKNYILHLSHNSSKTNIMSQRINAFSIGNKAVNALHNMGFQVQNSSLDNSFLELIYFRVSQMNGCAFCLDMHSKELRAKGETEQRIFLVSAWRECSFYTDKEKAGLLWAETLTALSGKEVNDEIYSQVSHHFSETEMVDLTMAVIAINSYNRINIAFGADVGAYQISEKA